MNECNNFFKLEKKYKCKMILFKKYLNSEVEYKYSSTT